MEQFDWVIVGGGIVGAATFYEMQRRHPEARMLLIEKMPGLADHQTGNNSGVIQGRGQAGAGATEYCAR